MARPGSLYIPSYVNLGNHPKTRRFARALGVSRVTAVEHLHFLWWWAATYAPDGNLSRVTNEDVTLGAEFEGDADGFVQALQTAGFLDDRQLHDWSDYAGEVLEKMEHKREIDRERQRRYRLSRAGHDGVTRDNSVSHAHKKREEKKREDKDTLSSERVKKPATASPSAPRKFRMPLDWAPSEANRTFARSRGMSDAEIDAEAEKFRDHFTGINPEARPGWDASWRSWILRALERPRPRAVSNSGNGTRPNYFAEKAKRMEQDEQVPSNVVEGIWR